MSATEVKLGLIAQDNQKAPSFKANLLAFSKQIRAAKR
jgi:hypothetical protein